MIQDFIMEHDEYFIDNEDDLYGDKLIEKTQTQIEMLIEPIMIWYPFGLKSNVAFNLDFKMNWFRRFMCWMCLGSKFKKVK